MTTAVITVDLDNERIAGFTLDVNLRLGTRGSTRLASSWFNARSTKAEVHLIQPKATATAELRRFSPLARTSRRDFAQFGPCRQQSVAAKDFTANRQVATAGVCRVTFFNAVINEG